MITISMYLKKLFEYADLYRKGETMLIAKLTMKNYKEKCRKKPKHGKLMESEIRFYRIYLRKCARKGIEPEPFYKKALGCYA